MVLLFSSAVWRLGARGVETLRAGLEPFEWAVLALLLLAFVYGEGYRALQRKYAPFVVGRARRLPAEPILFRLAGPLYAMALLGAERGRVLRSWAGVVAIVVAVLTVRAFPEPWRGITDLAVAAALAWGAAALLWEARATLR